MAPDVLRAAYEHLVAGREVVGDLGLERVVEGAHLRPGGEQLFAGKKAVVFSLPGAFTPTCSQKHLPGFVQRAQEIHGKGVDLIACLSVNDAFVMMAWAKEQGAGDSRA
jgi:peroxiredoxin